MTTDNDPRADRKRLMARRRQQKQRERDASQFDTVKLKVPKGRAEEVRAFVASFLAGGQEREPSRNYEASLAELEQLTAALQARIRDLEQENQALEAASPKAALLRMADAMPFAKTRKARKQEAAEKPKAYRGPCGPTEIPGYPLNDASEHTSQTPAPFKKRARQDGGR